MQADPLARASPPPPWPAGGKPRRGGSRSAGKAAQARPASSPRAQLGGRRPFPFPARPAAPSPSFLSPPRGWRLLGACKAVGEPGPPRPAELCSLCSWRGTKRVRVPGCTGSFHRHLCPQGPALPRRPVSPSSAPDLGISVFAHPRSHVLSACCLPGSGDPVGTLCYDSWSRESAAENWRHELGRGRGTGGGEACGAPGGGRRRTQEGGSREAGAPADLQAAGEALRAGAAAPSSWQPRRSQTQLAEPGERSAQDTHTQLGPGQGPAQVGERKDGKERSGVTASAAALGCRRPRSGERREDRAAARPPARVGERLVLGLENCSLGPARWLSR